MAQELRADQNLAAVRDRFLENFAGVFGYCDIKKRTETTGDLNALNNLND
jgi:hypothetical protein